MRSSSALVLGAEPHTLSLRGDGSPEAMRLVAAGEAHRRCAAARVEEVLPGYDPLGRSMASGVDTPTLLAVPADARVLDPGPIDQLLATGDLGEERAGLVDPATGRARPVPADIQTPRDGLTAAQNLDPYRGLTALRAGATLVLNDGQARFGPGVLDLCEDLATALRSLVQVNSYLSVGDARGFGAHWDDHDVVIVQVVGRKYWEVRAPHELGAVKGFTPPRAGGEVVWSGVLEPGRALAIPRGWTHRVQGLHDELSVHHTVSIRRPTGIELVARVPPAALESGQVLDDAAIEHAYGSWYADVVGVPRTGPVELYRAQTEAYRNHEVRVSLLGGIVFVDDECDVDRVVLRAGRRTVEVPRSEVDALASALGRRWWTVSGLSAAAGSDDARIVSLLDTLGHAGLVHLRATS